MRADYSKGLIKQVEELTVENERLKTENKRIRVDNRELSMRLTQLEATMEARIEAAVSSAVQKATAPLLAELAKKEEKIEILETEVSRLKAQINKNSDNSSQPPSQNERF